MSFSLLSIIALNGSIEAVDSFRLSLEASSARWFSVVKYAGYAVAVGCALEAPETFVTIKRWWLLKFRDEEREETKEEKKKWFIPLAAIGLLFIVVGIVVETYAEGKVSDVDALLRGHESDKITAAENDAGSAITKAAQLQNETQSLKTEAETQRGIAAGALQKAGEANAIAEKEKLDEAQLELLVSPRRLTLDQQEKIGHACLVLWGKPVIVSSYALDSEGRVLALEIIQSLKSGEIFVRSNIGYTLDTGDLDSGVLISGPAEADSFTACLGNALRTIGKLDVVVNGERHRGTAVEGTEFGGSFNCTNCRMEFDRSISIKGGPTGPGTPVIVKVGVRPDAVVPNVKTP